MPRFSTEVAKSHAFHEFPLTTFCTSYWMNFSIYYLFEQTSFKMSHDTIG